MKTTKRLKFVFVLVVFLVLTSTSGGRTEDVSLYAPSTRISAMTATLTTAPLFTNTLVPSATPAQTSTATPTDVPAIAVTPTDDQPVYCLNAVRWDSLTTDSPNLHKTDLRCSTLVAAILVEDFYVKSESGAEFYMPPVEKGPQPGCVPCACPSMPPALQ